jgi:hypothetical protein
MHVEVSAALALTKVSPTEHIKDRTSKKLETIQAIGTGGAFACRPPVPLPAGSLF